MNLVPPTELLGGIVAAGPVAAAMGLLVTGLAGATLVLVLWAERKRRTRLLRPVVALRGAETG